MTVRTYSAFPDIEVRSIWKSTKENNPILDKNCFFFYASGRSALYHGVSCLPHTERKKVLIPFYHCGVEVEAIVRAGLEVEFYPLQRNLEPDFIWIEENITPETVAILVIHYFGFPQPLERIRLLCRQKELFLIEDCAHALYSCEGERFLGTFGDIAIFSLMKTVGMPNGGGLLVNNRQLCAPLQGSPYLNMALLKKTVRSVLEFEANNRLQQSGFLARLMRKLLKRREAASEGNDAEVGNHHWYYEVPQYHYHHAMSVLSRFFLRPLEVEHIIKQRRDNYNLLLNDIHWNSAIQPLFGALDHGVCPLCCPVLVSDSDMWCEKLAQYEVFPFVFGRFSHPLIAEENFLSLKYFQQGIMGLPIHQQLELDNIKEISCRINKALEEIHG